MIPNSSSPRCGRRPRRWLTAVVPFILLVVSAGLAILPASHPDAPRDTRAAAVRGLPGDFTAALAQGRTPLGPAVSTRPASALDRERTDKIRTAIAAFQKGREQGTLAPAVRRVITAPAAGRPPHQAPESFLSEKQLRALSDLRRRAEKHVEVRVVPDDGSIRFLSGRRLEEPAAAAEPGTSLAATTARSFLRHNADLFAMADPLTEFKVVHEEKDSLGITQVRLRQQWHGVEVWPADAMVQINAQGAVNLFMGTYRPTPETTDVTPAVTAEDARMIAFRKVREDSGILLPGPVNREELVVFAPKRDVPPRLAWEFIIHGNMLTDWSTFVDAKTGVVIQSDRTACAAATTGSGTDLFGQTAPLKLWQDGAAFWMVDTTKQMFNAGQSAPPAAARVKGGITLHDAKGITAEQYNQIEQPSTAIEQISSNSATSGFPADAVSAAVDVGKVYDYYLSRHQRNSYDGNGGTVTVVVNVDFANATFNSGTGTMTFGLKKLSGNAGREFYARAFDVTAHEMTHGVTGTTAGLVYEYQSGALNEAFSDILGEVAEGNVYRNGQPDWLLGTNMTEQIRDMKNPERFNQPTKMSEFRNLARNQDAGGVHVNSGIINRCFYQLAEGLSPGIGVDKAEQIFYRALTGGKLQRNSQFVDCRLACVQVAQELHGNGSTEAQKVGAAFDVVEIFDQQAPPPPQPLPETSGADSTLFTFYWLDGFLYLGRREAALGDGADGIFLNSFFTLMPFTRPAVKGDGTQAFVVLSDNDGAFVDTQTGVVVPLNLPGQVASVAWSADASAYGFVFIDPLSGQRDNRVSVYDGTTMQTTQYELRSPVMDGGSTNTVLYADALDFTADGTLLVYDALNRVKDQFGNFRDSYSIYFLDRRSTQTFALAPPNPNLNVGNPLLGQRHNNLLVLEAEDPAAQITHVFATDLSSGAAAEIAAVTTVGGYGFPSYSGDDGAIFYTDPAFDVIARQNVGNDGVTPAGQAQAWISGHVGLIYRRGTYQSMPTLSVSVPDANAAEAGLNPGSFTVTRTGGDVAAVPFSVVLTGTATNGTDFQQLPFNFTIPAGAASVTITVTPVDDSLTEDSETITLTLQDGVNYRAGTATAGTVTLADNDVATGFAAWAIANGLAPTDETGDPDNDRRTNLMEYALGSNPKGANTVPDPRLVMENGKPVLEVTRTAKQTDITYKVEVSPGMQAGTWKSGEPDTTSLADTATSLRVRDNIGSPASRARFLRLKITRP